MSKTVNLISSAGRVLLVLADDRDSRLRDVAQALGLTERAVQNLIHELTESGLVRVEKRGRRNRYLLQRRKMLTTVGNRKLSLGNWLASWNTDAGGSPDTAESTPEKPVPEPPRRKKPEPPQPTGESDESPQAQLDF